MGRVVGVPHSTGSYAVGRVAGVPRSRGDCTVGRVVGVLLFDDLAGPLRGIEAAPRVPEALSMAAEAFEDFPRAVFEFLLPAALFKALVIRLAALPLL